MVLRIWVLAGPLRFLDPDETVTGLMAARIAHGSAYTYFAGQSYMGALEQYLQAPFAAAAPGNAFLLRVPQVALCAVACWLTHVVGARLLDPRRGAVAAWLFAAGPAFNLVYGAKTRGAYDAALVTGLAGLLLALRHRRGHRELRTAAAFGFCCGLGAWLSLVSAFLLLPALVLLLGAGWERRLRPGAAAVGGAVLGATPVLLRWGRRGPSTGLGGVSEHASSWQRFRGLIHPVLPEFLGLDWRVGEPVVPTWFAGAIAVLLAVVIGVIARQRLSRTGSRPDLLLLGLPIAALLYVVSPYTWYTAEPRYLFCCYPLLALAIAALLPARGRPGTALAVAAVVLIAGVAISTLVRYAPADNRPDLARLAEFLNRSGYSTVYADYQLAFPLDYYQPDRVVAVSWGGDVTRFPDLSRRVAAAPRFAYVVVATDEPGMIRLLDTAGVRYQRMAVGALRAFTNLRPALRPAELRAATSGSAPRGKPAGSITLGAGIAPKH